LTRAIVEICVGCDEPPPPGLIAGMRQFNDGQYFECHETLETLWKAERRPLRRLYQGVLQIGVALHHLERGNQRGAIRLLERGLNHLRWFAPACQGVDVMTLIADAEACLVAVKSMGSERADAPDLPLSPSGAERAKVSGRLTPRLRMIPTDRVVPEGPRVDS